MCQVFIFDDVQKCIANKDRTEECIQLLSRFTNSFYWSEVSTGRSGQ